MGQESDIQQKENIVKKGYDLPVKLLQLVYKKNNVLFSPFNIRVALALVHAAADGNTRDEIADLLGFSKDIQRIQRSHEILSGILREVENTSTVEVFGETGWEQVKANRISNANGIFVQEGINIIPSYKALVQSHYKGEAINVDFAKQSAKATDIINEFISKNTNGRIPKLFSDPVEPDTAILLAACLYFKGAWDEPFWKDSTTPGTFTSGSTKTEVKFMPKVDDIPYINIPSLQVEAVELRYSGNDASMFFVLPYENQTLDTVVSSLSGDILKEIVKKSRSTYVSLKIPQIKYKWSDNLNEPLKALGVKEVFGTKAKLSNIANIALRVSEVSHAAEIEVNEKGTEASAVTIVKMVPMSAPYHPNPPIPVHVDRPFLMFIYHHKTETVLFIGTVQNPNGS